MLHHVARKIPTAIVETLEEKYLKASSEGNNRGVGEIVFSTIIENVKSFFAREEELSVKPKPVPEAASEVFERPGAVAQPAPRIVERSLPPQKPTLPFTPDELRSAMKTPAKPEPARPAQEVQRDITNEIAAFETALKSAHATVEVTATSPVTPNKARPAAVAPSILDEFLGQSSIDDTFFGEFEQFLTNEGLDATAMVEKDLLWKMKEFHRHRQEGKQYFFRERDAQAAVQRKLAELKDLEREWFVAREQADAMEQRLAVVEQDIESHVAQLRQLTSQIRAAPQLEQHVPAGSEFLLADGKKLRSLSDLKAALRTMTDNTFAYHCSATRNDFSSWVRHIIGDNKLADTLEPIREKAKLEAVLSGKK